MTLPPIPTPATNAPLRGIVVCTTGEARGHDVWTDDVFLRQVAAHAHARPHGVKARFGHAPLGTDPVGTELGRFVRFRVVYHGPESARQNREVWQLKADFVPLETAANRAALDHLRQFAAHAPSQLGASLEFFPAAPAPPENPLRLPHERLAELVAIAFTSDPACNPAGLFAQPPAVPFAAIPAPKPLLPHFS